MKITAHLLSSALFDRHYGMLRPACLVCVLIRLTFCSLLKREDAHAHCVSSGFTNPHNCKLSYVSWPNM